MTKQRWIYGIMTIALLTVSACSPLKYVPEDKMLLRKTQIKSDAPEATSETLNSYLHQTPNNYFLGFWRMQLDFYNVSGPDSSKWVNRWLRRIGEPPVIYDSLKTAYSRDELQKVMFNKGFMEATVSSEEIIRKRQVKVVYNVTANEPYRIRNYSISLPDSTAMSYVERADTLLKPRSGDLFDSDALNAERNRITTALRNRGYYNFRKELLYFSVDSALGTHQVDAHLSIQRQYAHNDSALAVIFDRKRIENVTIIAVKDADLTRNWDTMPLDTFDIDGYKVVLSRDNHTFRPGTLVAKTYIIPGRYYNERRIDRTYAQLGSLSAVKYVNVGFKENDNGQLDATIIVSQDKPHTLSTEIEGTYSDGDFGIGLGLGYKNDNIFRGAEILNVNVSGGYETMGALTAAQSAWNVGGGASLTFPQLLIPSNRNFRRKYIGSTEISASVNFQQRPEYNRTIANAGFKYLWQRRRVNFTYNLIDISYIYLPRMSQEFKDKYMGPSSSIRFSYEDHFIMRMGFGVNYSNRRINSSLSSYFTLRANVKTAGNLLYGISNAVDQQKNEEGQYEIFNIPYSQYAKFDIDYAYNFRINKGWRLVLHTALGVGLPYGNATILPFEERYFTGGANSMRGWSARTLGPGNFYNSSGSIDFMKQSGDIKLDLNIETRFKIVWKLYGALFVDAGNVWTIRNYPEQPTGHFRFDTFYKQIGLNYGLGVRLDFDFFVIRLDMGIKLYDPGYPSETERWRTTLSWRNDVAFHFAVGYPF